MPKSRSLKKGILPWCVHMNNREYHLHFYQTYNVVSGEDLNIVVECSHVQTVTNQEVRVFRLNLSEEH